MMRTMETGESMRKIDKATKTAIGRFLSLIAHRYDIAGAILYGSRARATNRPDSDADLVVLLRGTPQRFIDVKLDMADVAFDAMLETDILVSPLPVWIEEWENPANYSNPALLANMRHEGIRV